jgi:4-diphosphocytidyl-2-C-methyl-D-erythritol kinase
MTEHLYQSPAKINWFLHITSQRPDGYHLLETVFQRIDWCDEIRITPRNDGIIALAGDLSGVPESANLAHRAASALKNTAGRVALGATIHLTKRIPTGAGLGGGSSNAATVLTALNQIWALHLPNQTLQQIGLTLGADVPFFVSGHAAAYATGVGEVLQEITLPNRDVFIISPNTHIATAAVFQHPALIRNHPPLQLTPHELSQCMAQSAQQSRFQNDLEPATFALNAKVQKAFNLLRNAAPNAWTRMSGSGATVFCAPTLVEEYEALRMLEANLGCFGWGVRWVAVA